MGNCSNILKDMVEFDMLKVISSEDYNRFFPYDDKISAKDIGICAFDKFNSGDFGDSDFLTPLYLKRSSAEGNGAN